MSPVILVVDDNDDNRFTLTSRLKLCGYSNIETAADGHSALARMRKEPVHLVLLDILMPDLDGFAVLRQMKSDPSLRDIPVIVASALDDSSSAARCIELGAIDYFTKPFDPVLLKARVDSCVERVQFRTKRADDLESCLVGSSAVMLALRQEILHLASMNVPVLIYGETGAGKEVVARCLHDFSTRSKNPFVAVNCAAVPESIFESEFFGHEAGSFTGATGRRIGRFEHASKGTLLLDEIEAMPMLLQAKILRVVQEQTVERLGSNKPIAVDVRVLAAAKVDLLDASRAGRFREDLYFRLNVAELHIPPLRNRREDVPELFKAFAQGAAKRYCIPVRFPDGRQMDELMQRPWPGNVRELRTAAERFVLSLADPGDPNPKTPAKAEASLSLADKVAAFEKQAIENALRRYQGNIPLVLAELDLPRRTLYHKMQRYGLFRDGFKVDRVAHGETA